MKYSGTLKHITLQLDLIYLHTAEIQTHIRKQIDYLKAVDIEWWSLYLIVHQLLCLFSIFVTKRWYYCFMANLNYETCIHRWGSRYMRLCMGVQKEHIAVGSPLDYNIITYMYTHTLIKTVLLKVHKHKFHLLNHSIVTLA